MGKINEKDEEMRASEKYLVCSSRSSSLRVREQN